MAYKGAVMVDDETLFKVMQTAHETGGLVMVHAENGDAIDSIVKETVAGRQHRPGLGCPAAGRRRPRWRRRTARSSSRTSRTRRSTLSMSPASRRSRLIALARGMARSGARRARSTSSSTVDDGEAELGGREVHLHAAPAAEGAPGAPLGRRSRPTRSRPSRHPPLPVQLARAKGGQRARVPEVVPNGGPGIENRLHMLWTHGVGTGRITPNRFVGTVSTKIAKLFGLYPRKGTIAPGSDADIVVWDPRRS